METQQLNAAKQQGQTTSGFMQNIKRLKIAAVIVGLLAVIILLVIARTERPLRIVVLFDGYTNNAAGEHVAMFRVKNHSGAKVVIWGYYKIEAQQQFQVVHPTVLASNTFISSELSEAIAIYPPETKGLWRASISCARYGIRVRWALFSGKHERFVDSIPERFRDVPMEEFASDWIK